MAKSYTTKVPEDSSLFYFQDLENPRLTWRLYSQSGGDLKLLATGFYFSQGSFSISHDYSNGFGDTIETSLRKGARESLRGAARLSRDVYDLLNPNNATTDRYQSKVLNWAKNTSLAQGLSWVGDKLGEGARSIPGVGDALDAAGDKIDKAKRFMMDAYSEALKTSSVKTQKDASKLYNETTISIPQISSLEFIIWTTPNSSCVAEIEELQKYFLGDFKLLDNGGGGYWTAPNDIDLAADNPFEDKEVKGAFTLKAGPYTFKNLLLKSFSWTYSKEYAAFPKADGEMPEVTEDPAYAKCVIDLDIYKFLTKDLLNSIRTPVKDTVSTKYNQNV